MNQQTGSTALPPPSRPNTHGRGRIFYRLFMYYVYIYVVFLCFFFLSFFFQCQRPARSFPPISHSHLSIHMSSSVRAWLFLIYISSPTRLDVLSSGRRPSSSSSSFWWTSFLKRRKRAGPLKDFCAHKAAKMLGAYVVIFERWRERERPGRLLRWFVAIQHFFPTFFFKENCWSLPAFSVSELCRNIVEPVAFSTSSSTP